MIRLSQELFKKDKNLCPRSHSEQVVHLKFHLCNQCSKLTFRRTTLGKLLSMAWGLELLVKDILYISQSIFAPSRPSGVAVSFLNNCLNKEVQICSISVSFQIVLYIVPYIPLGSTNLIGLHFHLFILCSLYVSAFLVPSGFEPSCLGPVLVLWTERGIWFYPVIYLTEPPSLTAPGQWNVLSLVLRSCLGFCPFQILGLGEI